MSAAQFAVLVIATLLAVAGGAAALSAELTGAPARGVRRRWLDAVGVLAPYAALAVLVWWIWQGI